MLNPSRFFFKNAGSSVTFINSWMLLPVTSTVNFEGEVKAIKILLLNFILKIQNFTRAVILVDSKPTIQITLKVLSIRECRQMLQTLKRQQKHIMFQWIPSHIGLMGNEMADFAKKGSRMSCQPSLPRIGSDICVLCNQNFMMKKHLFQCTSLNRERQQAKDISNLYWEARRKIV